MPAHVRKDDLVMVICGDDKNVTGKVLRVIPKRKLVVVEGVNVHKKHLRKTEQNPRGGVTEKEMPISIANVLPVVDGKPTRVRFETKPDGTKIRVAVSNGQQIGRELRKASK